jgi:bacterioferritin-associated ferredoxin
MIVCSCNVLSDHEVRHAVNSADNLPRNTKQIYGCLGCSVECDRCVCTIKDKTSLCIFRVRGAFTARALGTSI